MAFAASKAALRISWLKGRRTAPPATSGTDAVAAPEYYDFTRLEPDRTSPAGSHTWIVRGQNVALAYTRPVPGDRFGPVDQASEYVLILVHTIVLFPTTTVSGDTYVWGPHSQALDPAEWRRTVTQQPDGSYDWALDGRSRPCRARSSRPSSAATRCPAAPARSRSTSTPPSA